MSVLDTILTVPGCSALAAVGWTLTLEFQCTVVPYLKTDKESVGVGG